MRIGLSQIHRAPGPELAMMMRKRGMGQVVPIAPFPPLAEYLTRWFTQENVMSGVDAAVGCGPGGNLPCASPEDAAQMVYLIASQQCAMEQADTSFAGYVDDPACNDQGVAAASAIYPQVLAYFQSLPASVWSAEVADAASGNYGGPIPAGPCPSGTVWNMTNGVISCNPINPVNVIQGAPVNITAGAPLATPVSSTPVSIPASAPSQAPSASQPSAPSQTTGTNSSTSSASAAATSDPFAFLTQDAIAGIPNWMLLAGGLAVVMILPSLLGGRR